MEEKPNYYSIIPANVRYDDELNANAKLLYSEVTALSNKNGYCLATNEYFAKLYNVSPRTITEWIRKLEEKGYIKSEIETKRYEDGTIKKYRKIFIHHIEVSLQNHIEVLQQNHVEVSQQNHIEENFLYNNINNKFNKLNLYNNNISPKGFKKPTLEEVETYCKERNNNIDAEDFINYYDKIGWVYGKNRLPIKDWKACVRTWEKKRQSEVNNSEWF